jgi:hypothetical protein
MIPHASFRIGQAEWNLTGAAISPGQTSSGLMPIIRLDGGGFWRAVWSSVSVRNRNAELTWRAMRMHANGGATAIIVPRCDGTQPWPLDSFGNAVRDISVPHSDGAFFSDGSGYTQASIRVALVSSVAARATSLTVNKTFAGELHAGMAFSVDHPTFGWRMYEITNVAPQGGSYVLSFLPPMRELIAAGTELEFDLPRCTMRAANVNAFDYTQSRHPYALQSADFVETFPPL